MSLEQEYSDLLSGICACELFRAVLESGTRWSQQWQQSDTSDKMSGHCDPGSGDEASNGITNRYASRGWKSRCRRQQRRQLQRESKEVPPELMPKPEKALTLSQQEQRRMLQQKLISLQKALERCKTKSETDKDLGLNFENQERTERFVGTA